MVSEARVRRLGWVSVLAVSVIAASTIAVIAVDPAPAEATEAYEASVLASSPYAYWRLGDAPGTLGVDSVGNHPFSNAASAVGAAGRLSASPANNRWAVARFRGLGEDATGS